MADKLERLIRSVYRRSKRASFPEPGDHPEEEDIACFLEGKLSQEEAERVQGHLLICDECMDSLTVQLKIDPVRARKVPRDLLRMARGLVGPQVNYGVLEIALKLKDKAIEILSASGDLLLQGKKIPLPVLRGREIKELKDEVKIFKDFNDMAVEVKIENKQGKFFKLNVRVSDKSGRKKARGLRITLIKDDVELESYHTDSGNVIFEHVLPGKYKVEIDARDARLVSIMLDIKA